MLRWNCSLRFPLRGYKSWLKPCSRTFRQKPYSGNSKLMRKSEFPLRSRKFIPANEYVRKSSHNLYPNEAF